MQAIIIDDDMPTVVVILSSMDLCKFGIDKVHSAYNIETARKLFEENDIDIAICDIEMPKGSGLDLIKWAREKSYDTETAISYLTEKFRSHDENGCIDVGDYKGIKAVVMKKDCFFLFCGKKPVKIKNNM